MSLLNENDGECEVRLDFEPVCAPPLPGEGPIVYMQAAGPLLIVARQDPGEVLASVWSWFQGCDHWERCYIA